MGSDRDSHRIFVARAEHKFSCAHMTVFPDGRKERLHGHNYTLSLALDLADLSFDHLIDFGLLKKALAWLCAEWRETTLIAAKSPHARIDQRDGEVELVLCGARYVFPAEDVRLLPIANTSVEDLATLAAARLTERLAPALCGSAALGLEVRVEESPGQGAAVYRPLAPTL